MNRYFSAILSIIPLCLFLLCSNQEKRETKYENGQPKEIYFVKKDSIGNYVKNGQYTAYFENGQVKENGMFKDGKENGLFVKMEDGPLRVMFSKYEYIYQDGKVLKSTVWDGEGHKVRVCIFKNIYDTVGLCTEWDKDGNVKEQWTDEDKAKIIQMFKTRLKGSFCYKGAILGCLTIDGVDKSCINKFMDMIASTTSEDFAKYGSCEDNFKEAIENFFTQFDDKGVGNKIIQRLIDEGYIKKE